MTLKLYDRRDIHGALIAIKHATDNAVLAAQIQDDEYARGYREGYTKALKTMALLFDLIDAFPPEYAKLNEI